MIQVFRLYTYQNLMIAKKNKNGRQFFSPSFFFWIIFCPSVFGLSSEQFFVLIPRNV